MTDCKNQYKQHITRRQFIKTTAAGAVAIYTVPDLVFGNELKSRVVHVGHAGLVNPDGMVNKKNARQSVDTALKLLTQKENIKDAWQTIFPEYKTGETIGLKVNCVNRKCPTHPEIAYSIADSVIETMGLDPNHIIIWDRTNSELKKGGYTLNNSEKGIRCFGTVEKFSIPRWLINKPQNESGGIGYDKTLKVDVGKGVSSHLSKILTRMCTYLINVPVLKDHGIAGVTLSLKNHYGSIDNPRDCHTNSCDPFAAKINATAAIRDKTKLILLDAAYGVYEGGPRGAPQWQHKSILASTDPVALDAMGMEIINAKRKENNEDPVTGMASHIQTAASLGLGKSDPKMIDNVIKRLT
jgi:uncharacterized protein (DUF362 family)